MALITDTASLAAFCSRLADEDFVTVDTEFLREKTYWPQLCLVQLAGEGEAAAVDALAPGIDLGPLYDLFADEDVLKVFHAARQDVEIFVQRTGAVPTPIFDTQIAAMVCGYGEQAGYDTLVQSLTGAAIDKSSRFTDWSLRPLTERQVAYALSDVTHLRKVYRKLQARLDQSGRLAWLANEMEALADPATYRTEPRDAWRRLRVRTQKPRFLSVLREVAAWREEAAQHRDLPRNRLLRDEALIEIAASTPRSVADLARTRGLPESMAKGRMGQDILVAVERGLAVPDADAPAPPDRPDGGRGTGAIVELLKVLLRLRADKHNVAQRLIASSDEIERIAAEDAPDVPALQGWRREIFGEDALALKRGELALTLDGRRLVAMRVEPGAVRPARPERSPAPDAGRARPPGPPGAE
jgi:ribonuclease D